MGSSSTSVELRAEKLEASKQATTLAMSATFVGALVFVIGLIKFREQVWASYLTAFFYFSCLALGGLFFAAINHIVKAGWSTSIRRLSESFTAFMPVILIGGLVLIAGLKYLYPWADAERVTGDRLLEVKMPYLNLPFFVIRLVVFGLGCLFFAKKLVGFSLSQDLKPSDEPTHRSVGFSIAFVFFFALAFSLFSVDLLMALNPYWYSTIFGIYCFSGLFQASLALLILFVIWAKNSGRIAGYITSEHLHDLGKFLKGFTVFWAYIAFSQFMLIWYANIPEETEYYLMRAHGGWLALGFVLLVFRFIVPFLALLPKWAKREETHLKMVCILILIMQFVDIYWMVGPNFRENPSDYIWLDLGLMAFFGGVFFLMVFRFLGQNKAVAVNDPRIKEAINHHVTY